MLLGQKMSDEIMSLRSISIDLNSGNTCQISQVHWTKLGRTHTEGTLLKQVKHLFYLGHIGK